MRESSKPRENMPTRAFAAVSALACACALTSAVSAAGWEDNYAFWRRRDPATMTEWREAFDVPTPRWPPDDAFNALSTNDRQDAFLKCITDQAADFQRHASLYREPVLQELRRELDAELARRQVGVTLVVFWGRYRYVTILWPYLKRNLRVNGGVVDKVVLLHFARVPEEAVDGNLEFLANVTAQHPDAVQAVPFCEPVFGCAYDVVLNRTDMVYVKLDDDIVFVKDGSIEHLVYENLLNPEYSFYSGSVVNNPHSAAVHRFVGAYPPESYHWDSLGAAAPPWLNLTHAPVHYYGKRTYDDMGSQAHEAFVYNVASNRLDVYSFPVWNMNACRCGKPQEALSFCDEQGYYRWNINVVAWMRKPVEWAYAIPSFDEPHVSMNWPGMIPPHRAGMVGGSLFVHLQFVLQRHAKPDFGLREDVLLPWYAELAAQYTRAPYGGWQGNRSLLHHYEDLQAAVGEQRHSGNPYYMCADSEMRLERRICREQMRASRWAN